MKIGDKVKFLNESGGGIISGFQSKYIALVQDEDGFEIPTPTDDIVVCNDVEENSDKTNEHTIERNSNSFTHIEDTHLSLLNEPVKKKDDNKLGKSNSEETIDNEELSVFLGFIHNNINNLVKSKLELYIINDSSYDLLYCIASAKANMCKLIAKGEIESHTKIPISEIDPLSSNIVNGLCIQLLSYRTGKSFSRKPTIDVNINIDLAKSNNLNTFKENDFFNQPALIFPIIENDVLPNDITDGANEKYQKSLKNALKDKIKYDISDGGNKPHIIKSKTIEPLVIDLHSNMLLSTTAGMQPFEILSYQLNVFKQTLEENKNKRGLKIIFIHGKGQGVLRQEIIKELNHRYKQYKYQDASFREYGYGATMVIIN
jgi:hypothetical protein